jgi:hypothetical protein
MSGIVGSLINHRGSGIVSKLGTDAYQLTSQGAGVKAAIEQVVAGGLANDAVTLAKLASGTDGNLISYDTSGDPVAVATGSDGQVLTSAGAGAVCLFEDAAGGGTNSPFFYAALGSTQVIADQTLTKIENTARLDVDSTYDGSNFRVTPGVAGYYYFFMRVTTTAGNLSDPEYAYPQFQKNGSDTQTSNPTFKTMVINQAIMAAETIVLLDDDDYVEVFMWHNAGENVTLAHSGSTALTYWFGWKLA